MGARDTMSGRRPFCRAVLTRSHLQRLLSVSDYAEFQRNVPFSDADFDTVAELAYHLAVRGYVVIGVSWGEIWLNSILYGDSVGVYIWCESDARPFRPEGPVRSRQGSVLHRAGSLSDFISAALNER